MNNMKLLPREEIDEQRWDNCVISSPFFRHYALTYYMDSACEFWMGLLDEDYSWVWPVPIKKFPVSRVYQPLLSQQLGPYGASIDGQVVQNGLLFLKRHFAHIRIKLNDQFQQSQLIGELEQHQNFELDLSLPYTIKGYNRTVQSNLKKSEKAKLTIQSSNDFDSWCVETFKHSKGIEINALKDDFYIQVENVFKAFAERDSALCFTAFSEAEKVAQVLVLNSNNRLLFLFSASNIIGKQFGTMHAIVDAIIKEYSGRPFVLDFEGSNDPGLAYFYGGFGAEHKVYLQLTESRLKWPLNRLIK